MKKETFYRLCYLKNNGGRMIAIKEQGYVRSFKTNNGNEVKLALDKNATNYVRITEVTTGICCNNYESTNYNTYAKLIDYLNRDKEYIDTIYKKAQQYKDMADKLAFLIERGMVKEGKNYK